MQKKLIFALLAMALVAMALVGVAFAQFVGAQTQNSTAPQIVQLPNGQYVYGVPASINGTLVYPCYPFGIQGVPQGVQPGAQQGNVPYYQYGGRGMCGRFW
jgi:hypothetical protein